MISELGITNEGFREDGRHPWPEVRSQKAAILMMLIGVSKTHNKAYCWISQNRQLELLSKYHSFDISRRTLNRRLKELVQEGYIIRIRRHIKNGQGGIRFNSTLYKFKAKVFVWLRRLGGFIRKALSFARVPYLAQHSTLREEEISKGVSANVEILWKTDEKGRASPIKGIL
jgi:predicted transcriptional regulator